MREAGGALAPVAAVGFSDRLASGKSFEDAVQRFCSLHAISVAKNGTEHTHPAFVAKLRPLTDRGSKFIRFAPDGVMLTNNGVIHWEAKSSKALERDAYETYMLYHRMGCSVLLFMQPVRTAPVYAQWVERVRFVPSRSVVGKFHPAKQHPIDAEDWICPRYGSGYAGAGSGTPYREVDFASFKKIENFHEAANQAGAQHSA